jgi:septation ring formation regulator EzrA
MYISVDPTLVTTIVTTVVAFSTVIWTIIKIRRRKIIVQVGKDKIHIEGHSFSEELQILRQMKIHNNQPPAAPPPPKQLDSKREGS